MTDVTDAGPYLCIVQLRNAARAFARDESSAVDRLHAAIDLTEQNTKELLERIKRLEGQAE